MNTTCKTKNLSEAFQLVSSVVESKATKRILQDVKIETIEKKGIQLSATDLEVAVKCTVDAVAVETEGAAVVPAAHMNSILRESLDEAMNLRLEGGNFFVSGKDSFFRLPTQNPEEFPVVPDFPKEKTLEIARDDLGTIIRRTIFAVAMEQTRYALNGMLFRPRKGKLTVVATDGRRLAQITRKAKVEGKEAKQAIIPTKAVALLEKMLTQEDDKVGLAFLENKVWARTGKATLCAALVEGQFPDYDAVVPADCQIKIVIPTEDLLLAVRRVALLTDQESQVVRLKFENNMLTLRYEAPERGEAKVDLPIKYEDQPLEICFNPHFIVDMLRVIEEKEVVFELKDSNSPGLLRAGEDYLYLIMPISVSEE